GCQYPDVTQQIGCLVHASPCSVGIAGMTAYLSNPNKALAMRTPAATGCDADLLDNDGDSAIDEAGEACGAVLPTTATIRRLNDPNYSTGGGLTCGDAAAYAAGHHYDARYPLSRELWFNSIKGFRTTTSPDNTRTFANIDNTYEEQDLIKCACDK